MYKRQEISGSSSIGLIDDKRILSAESEPGNWLAFGRTYDERRFSPLNQINKELPAGRMAQPYEMSGLAIYLASPAGSYSTGGVYTADGGYMTM